LKIGIVGPCGSGKTTLVAGLKQTGIQARSIAQEHSFVPEMWKRLTNPDLLIYLHASYPLTVLRKKLDWTPTEYEEQLHRLRHARQNANLVIDTDPLAPIEVLQKTIIFLETTKLAEISPE
jgi:adenylate kinase family enzyme